MLKKTTTRVLAVSSGGGHLVQLLRLRPAFVGCDVSYATVSRNYQQEIGSERLYVIPDCNRSQKFRMVLCALGVLALLIRLRPDVVVSTGAAPGYFAILLAYKLGIRTVWVDSIANAEELSMSGRLVRKYAQLWLTQWPHLAAKSGPHYVGSVL